MLHVQLREFFTTAIEFENEIHFITDTITLYSHFFSQLII